MFRNCVILAIGAALLATGCVPVTEPVGDVSKAEPDKNLLGTWEGDDTVVIDVPEVKNNPKGLMRASSRPKSGEGEPFWFFTTTIGKHSYANIIMAPAKAGTFPQFDKDGAFAEWQKEPKKRYFIFRYKIDGAKLLVDGANKKVVDALMEKEKIKATENFFVVPSGWLAKYLEKNDPDKIYDESNSSKYTRAKK
jgi:hypothetical protein